MRYAHELHSLVARADKVRSRFGIESVASFKDELASDPRVCCASHTVSDIWMPMVVAYDKKVVSCTLPRRGSSLVKRYTHPTKDAASPQRRVKIVAALVGTLSILAGVLVVLSFHPWGVHKLLEDRNKNLFVRVAEPVPHSRAQNPFSPITSSQTIKPRVASSPEAQPPTSSSALGSRVLNPPGSPVSKYGELLLNGTQIIAANTGEPLQLRGNSLFWSNTGYHAEAFYNAEVVAELRNYWDATVIRAAMGIEDAGGYLHDPSANKARVKVVVEAALNLGIYVIIDWHSHEAENSQDEAIKFFQEMAELYGSYPNTIYEVYNEPVRQPWSTVIKPYAEAVIASIRRIDPDNLVLVGSRQWSQRIDEAAADPIRDNKIAYAFHFYAATHRRAYRTFVDDALAQGVAVFCTEWGAIRATGDGNVDLASTRKWIQYLDQRNISHCNWAVYNRDVGSSIVVPSADPKGGWTYPDDLTASGLLVWQILTSYNKKGGKTNVTADHMRV